MLGPMNQFDTSPVLHGQFKQQAKIFPLTGLTAAAIILHLWNGQTETHKFGKGTISITDAASGMFDYHWHRDDTSTEGLWDVWVELRTADGPLSSTNTETLQVVKRITGYGKRGVGRVHVA